MSECESCELLKQRIVVLEQLVNVHRAEIARYRSWFDSNTEALMVRANELQQKLDALEEVSDDGEASDRDGPAE